MIFSLLLHVLTIYIFILITTKLFLPIMNNIWTQLADTLRDYETNVPPNIQGYLINDINTLLSSISVLTHAYVLVFHRYYLKFVYTWWSGLLLSMRCISPVRFNWLLCKIINEISVFTEMSTLGNG
jgi:hypothetical protein